MIAPAGDRAPRAWACEPRTGLRNPSPPAHRCPSTGLSRSPFGIKRGFTMPPSRPSHARAVGSSRRTTARPSASSCGCAARRGAQAVTPSCPHLNLPPLPSSTTTWSSHWSRSSLSARPCTRARRRTIRRSSSTARPGLKRVQSTMSGVRPGISTSGCVHHRVCPPRTPRAVRRRCASSNPRAASDFAPLTHRTTRSTRRRPSSATL